MLKRIFTIILTLCFLSVAGASDAKPASCCWINPSDKKPFNPEVSAKVNGGNVEFFIRIPYEKLGLSPAVFQQGIQFNLIVNDNDGEGRDGWIQVALGIGEGKTPELYPFIVKQ